jgi:hypothetical protein
VICGKTFGKRNWPPPRGPAATPIWASSPPTTTGSSTGRNQPGLASLLLLGRHRARRLRRCRPLGSRERKPRPPSPHRAPEREGIWTIQTGISPRTYRMKPISKRPSSGGRISERIGQLGGCQRGWRDVLLPRLQVRRCAHGAELHTAWVPRLPSNRNGRHRTHMGYDLRFPDGSDTQGTPNFRLQSPVPRFESRNPGAPVPRPTRRSTSTSNGPATSGCPV